MRLAPLPTDGGGRSSGRYKGAAIALLVLGVLCVLLELQSPSLIMWTGERVVGTNDGGIAYYVVDGEQRTLNVPGEPPPHPLPVTVYVDRDDYSHDRVASPAKWLDAALVSTPFLAAGVVLALGVHRRGPRRGLVPRR